MGTLTVQTLQAPTSGANANKVIIPSGHTLDASNGLLTPADYVIQTAQNYARGSVASSSTSYVVTGLDIDFTPSSTSSKVLITASFDIDTGASSRQAYATLYRDSTRLDTIGDSGSLGLTNIYDAGDRNIVGMTVQFLDAPSSTSQLHYELYFKTTGGSVTFCSQNARQVITAMEIA
jgi:hypothetical protein